MLIYALFLYATARVFFSTFFWYLYFSTSRYSYIQCVIELAIKIIIKFKGVLISPMRLTHHDRLRGTAISSLVPFFARKNGNFLLFLVAPQF